MKGWKGIIAWPAIIGTIVVLSYISSSRDRETKLDLHNSSETVIEREEAIDDHWDEIRDYLSGTETIDVCSGQSGNCYSLDADIYDGQVVQIYFLNGGYLYFGADIDENGYASDFDLNGNEWDFALDMDSSAVDDAISEWADDNEYTIDGI